MGGCYIGIIRSVAEKLNLIDISKQPIIILRTEL